MTFECSSDSEAVTEAGTGVPGAGNLQEGTCPSWRSGAKIREGFPEVVPKCNQKGKQKPVRQMGRQRKALPSKSTDAAEACSRQGSTNAAEACSSQGGSVCCLRPLKQF